MASKPPTPPSQDANEQEDRREQEAWSRELNAILDSEEVRRGLDVIGVAANALSSTLGGGVLLNRVMGTRAGARFRQELLEAAREIEEEGKRGTGLRAHASQLLRAMHRALIADSRETAPPSRAAERAEATCPCGWALPEPYDDPWMLPPPQQEGRVRMRCPLCGRPHEVSLFAPAGPPSSR